MTIPLTPERILEAVSKESQVSVEDLLSPRRDRKFVRPRQLAMFLIRTHCSDQSLTKIARFMGRSDHKSVIHACDFIGQRLRLMCDCELEALHYQVMSRLEPDWEPHPNADAWAAEVSSEPGGEPDPERRTKAERPCLRCRMPFKPAHSQNWMCKLCNEAIGKLGIVS